MIKKLFTTVLLCLALFAGGCSDGKNSSLIIMAQMQRSDIYGSGTPVIFYSVSLMDFSTFPAVTGATVTVSGPGRVTEIAEVGPGIYAFTSSDPLDYQIGGSYTVTVSAGGAQYTASATAPGNITFTAGCTQMSWQYDGNYNLVQVVDPSNGTHMFGPDPSAENPFNMDSHGAFTWGSGEYSVLANVASKIDGTFSGSHFSSQLIIENNLGGIPVIK